MTHKLSSLEEDFRAIGLDISSPSPGSTAQQVVEAKARFGQLYDYRTGEEIRPATKKERDDSREAAGLDGGAGVIKVGGRSVYVQETEGASVTNIEVARTAEEVAKVIDEHGLDVNDPNVLDEVMKIIKKKRGPEARREKKKRKIFYRQHKAAIKRAGRKFRRSAAGKAYSRKVKRAPKRSLGPGRRRHFEQHNDPHSTDAILDELTQILGETRGRSPEGVERTEECRAFSNCALSADLLSRHLVPVRGLAEHLLENGDLEEDEHAAFCEYVSMVDQLTLDSADYAEELAELGALEADEPSHVEEDFSLTFATLVDLIEVFDDLREDFEPIIEEETDLAEAAMKGMSDEEMGYAMKAMKVMKDKSDEEMMKAMADEEMMKGMSDEAMKGMKAMRKSLKGMSDDEAMKAMKGMRRQAMKGMEGNDEEGK